jgi:ABC-2 type transport system permease protein
MKLWLRGVVESLRRIRWLARKELWQFWADKFFSGLLVGLPIMELILVVNIMGDQGGRGQPIAVLDQDHSRASRQLVTAIENTGEAWPKFWPEDLEEANRALRLGDAAGLVVIPPDMEDDLRDPRASAELAVAADGSSSWSASGLLGAVSGAIGAYLRSLAPMDGGAELELRPTRYFEITRVQDPVSSQLAFMLYQVVLLVSASALAREREKGTLEQLLVAPLRELELIVGKATPVFILGMVCFTVMFAMGRLIWNVPMRGSHALLFLGALLFILAEGAWGLFLSSHVQNQQQAVQIIFVQILFDMSFCGYVVPVDNLPWLLRTVSQVLPLRHFIYWVRTVMLRGGDIAALGPSFYALPLLGAAFWLLAVRTLRQKLD